MGTLTVHFEGICTQIKLPQPAGGVAHRTVLVLAETPQMLHTHLIEPHIAHVMVEAESDIVSTSLDEFESHAALVQQGPRKWKMAGVRLQIQNVTNSSLVYESSLDLAPSLTALTPGFGALSEDVVFGKDAACHFDVSLGTFSGTQLAADIAVHIDLQVTTSDASPVLSIDALDPATPASGTLTLADGATVLVTNTAGAFEDSRWDFLLHYKTAAVFPANPGVPDDELLVVSPREDDVLGPGCSNANWP